MTQVLVDDDADVQAGDPLFSQYARRFELAVQLAEANLSASTQSIDASGAALVAAQAAVTQARTTLDTTRAQSDRVTRLEERGIAATAGANLESARTQLGPRGAGNPALTFIDAAAAWATVDLRENLLQNVDAGDPVGLSFDAVPGHIFDGRVQSLAWASIPVAACRAVSWSISLPTVGLNRPAQSPSARS